MHHLAHRTEPLDRVAPDEAVDLQKLLVGKAEIGFAHRHQLVAAFARDPDPERIVGIIRRALAVTALRIHQYRIDDEGIALPFPPQALGPSRHIERGAGFEHDALDRRRIGAGAGGHWIFSRRNQLVPAAECDQRRQIDPFLIKPHHKIFEPLAPLGKGPLTQVLPAVGEETVGAQMRGKIRHQLGRDGFAVEALLQHVEALHPAIAHDQQFPVDRARQAQGLDEIGEAFRNFLAGARIKPRHEPAIRLTFPAGDRLNADAVPFPLGHEIRRVECREVGVLERMRQHRRPERRRIGADRFVSAAFQPSE